MSDRERVIEVRLTESEARALADAWRGDPDAYAGSRADWTDNAVLKIEAALAPTPPKEAP